MVLLIFDGQEYLHKRKQALLINIKKVHFYIIFEIHSKGKNCFFGLIVAWIEAKIPPCPFDPNNFRVYSFSHEYNTAPYAN